MNSDYILRDKSVNRITQNHADNISKNAFRLNQSQVLNIFFAAASSGGFGHVMDDGRAFGDFKAPHNAWLTQMSNTITFGEGATSPF